MIDDLDRMWEEAVVAYFRMLSQYLLAGEWSSARLHGTLSHARQRENLKSHKAKDVRECQERREYKEFIKKRKEEI